MLTINIKHSKSKHYAEVLRMVLDAGGRMNDGVLVLEVPDNILLYCYETLIPIVEIVSKWKGTEAFYNSKKVELFRFLYNAWGNIGQCAKGRNDTWNSRWCWQNIDNQGWGCKHLQSFSAFNYGDGRYKRSNRFWYNFGEFESPTKWKINKRLIYETISKEAESKSLHLCPFYNIERIRQTIEDLPNYINVDGVNYAPYINESGEAVNIRHIHKFSLADTVRYEYSTN